MSVAESDAEFAFRLYVLVHRETVVDPCRVDVLPVFKDGSDVGKVDGLSERTVEFAFTFQRLSEDAVGLLQVSNSEVNISQTVERDDAVFLGLFRLLVAILHREGQRVVMILCCDVVDAEPAIVGSNVVECLNHFDGIGNGSGEVDRLLVVGNGHFEVALVAVGFSCVLCSDNAVVNVAFFVLCVGGLAVAAAEQDNATCTEEAQATEGAEDG